MDIGIHTARVVALSTRLFLHIYLELSAHIRKPDLWEGHVCENQVSLHIFSVYISTWPRTQHCYKQQASMYTVTRKLTVGCWSAIEPRNSTFDRPLVLQTHGHSNVPCNHSTAISNLCKHSESKTPRSIADHSNCSVKAQLSPACTVKWVYNTWVWDSMAN